MVERYLSPLGYGVWLALISGAYQALPGAGYLALLVLLLATAARPRVMQAPLAVVPISAVAGAALFNVAFLLMGLVHELPPREYFVHLFAMSLFLAGLAWAPAQAGSDPTDRLARFGRRFALAGLAALLAGQILQSAGWLWWVEPPIQDSLLASLVFRPGGFLNPNMTASLALILLLMSGLHQSRMGLAGAAVLVLVAAVVALTQSRAALLVLAIYGLFLAGRRPAGVLAGTAVVVAGLAWMADLNVAGTSADIAERFAARFTGDSSSDERARILALAANRFDQAPWLGSGHQFLQGSHGVGSHNSVVELFVSFGVVGGLPMLLAGVAMLLPVTAWFVVLGVLPSLMFSHNYFDSASLQAALGLALAVERARLQRPSRATRAQFLDPPIDVQRAKD